MSSLDTFQLEDHSKDYRLRSLYRMIPKGGSLLDVGSGSGVIADMLASHFSSFMLLDHSKPLVEKLAADYASRDDVHVVEGSANSFELNEKFDVITLCDVIEHLEDDVACLRRVKEHLKNDGVVFISVPACQFLYGIRDKQYGHYRRYNKNALKEILRQAGLSIQTLHYWNATGVLPYIISEKILKKPLQGPARSNITTIAEKTVNTILYWILSIETRVHAPIGLSLIAVACKKEKRSS